MIEWIIELAAGILGVIVAVILQWVAYKRRKKTKKDASKMLDELSDIMKTASMQIEDLEKEIEEKRRKVIELEELRQRYIAIAKMKREQVDAIKKEITEIIERSGRRTLIKDVVVNGVFFILGVIATLILAT